MNGEAVEKANDHLERVILSVLEFQAAEKTTSSMKSAWYNFLTATNTIFSKLEQGAKTNPRSISWFLKYKTLRREDELLQYIHQARHAEEHGLAGSFSNHGIYVTAGNKWTKVINNGLNGEPIRIEVESGKPAAGQTHFAEMYLLPVTNRGVRYQVPKTHLGEQISPTTIEHAMSMTLQFLTNMIDEARLLIPPDNQ